MTRSEFKNQKDGLMSCDVAQVYHQYLSATDSTVMTMKLLF